LNAIKLGLYIFFIHIHTSGNRAESFLTSCIPDLQLDTLTVKIDSANFEIYPEVVTQSIVKYKNMTSNLLLKTEK
jgi:hypothetical protein